MKTRPAAIERILSLFSTQVSSCDIIPHCQARPVRRVGDSILVGEKRVGEENIQLRCAVAVKQAQLPDDRCTIVVKTAHDFRPRGTTALFQCGRCRTGFATPVLADANMKMRAAEMNSQVTVKVGDRPGLAGTAKLVGAALDDWAEDDRAPVVFKYIAQQFLEKIGIDRQAVNFLSVAVAGIDLGNNFHSSRDYQYRIGRFCNTGD